MDTSWWITATFTGGAAVGAVVAHMKQQPKLKGAIAGSLSYTVLAGTYMGFRSLILWADDRHPSTASGLAGFATGATMGTAVGGVAVGVQGAALFGGLAFAADYGIDSFTSWRERQAEALLLAKTRQKEGKEEEGDKPLEVPLRGGKSQAPYIPARKPPSTAPPINDFWANTPAWFPVRRMDWDAEEQKLVAQIARIDDLLRLSAPKRPPAAT